MRHKAGEKVRKRKHIFLFMINGFLTKTVQSVGSEVRRTITTRQDFYNSHSPIVVTVSFCSLTLKSVIV